MIDYDKNKESFYLKFWCMNNLCGWTMSQKLTVNSFQWVEYISEFMKNYNEENAEGYLIEVDVQYPENVHKI